MTAQDLARQFEREWGRVKAQAVIVLPRSGYFIVHQHIRGAVFLETRLTAAHLRRVLEALRQCPDHGARYLQGGDDGQHN